MNKKVIKVVGLSLATAWLMVGCASSSVAPEEKVDDRCRTASGQLAPEWTCNPYMEGAIVALGQAKPNAGNDRSFQRAEAMAEGRDALAQQISTKVSNMIKSYKGATGSGKDATFDKSVSKVSKQLASQTLQGSRGIKTWYDKEGEVYILVGVPTDSVKGALDKAIKTSYKNDQALYQQFLAHKAQGDLEKELEKADMN